MGRGWDSLRFRGLTGQRGRPSWKSPRTGLVENWGGVSEGEGWPGAGEPEMGRVLRETNGILIRYAMQEATLFNF